MSIEWCAKCQKVQIMNIFIFDIEKAENSYSKKKNSEKSYYCSVCSSFIKKEKEGSE